jgi:hypothetical protein
MSPSSLTIEISLEPLYRVGGGSATRVMVIAVLVLVFAGAMAPAVV